MINAICCCDNNWAIGKNNDLLYKLSEDMRYFKRVTLECGIVAMGENTLLSFPNSKPLKNRVNIVLCPEGHDYDGCICYHDFDELVHDLQLLSTQHDIFIIGGAMFYKSMLPYCDNLYITKVDAACEDATAYFPNLDTNPSFKCDSSSDIIKDGEYNIKFLRYTRVKV